MNSADATVGDGAADVVAVATALRWSRPDLTRLLSEHLLERADALGDRDAWLVAAGWRVHAVHSVGDGREVAADALEELRRWDDGALHSRAAARLRVELAGVAHDAGDSDVARRLLAPTAPASDPELVADRATVLTRVANDAAAVSAAEEAWSALGAPRAGVGVAAVQLASAVNERREGRADEAIARAVAGLTRLDRSREAAGSPTPAGHLAAALAAEWIAALVDSGRWAQARDVIAGLAARLGERTRATRQLAYLRSTIARVLAADPEADAAEELERAARDAADADVPELEHVCRVALGELYEARGQLEAALESIRLAVMAERRHRARGTRLRGALAMITPSTPLGAGRLDTAPASVGGRERTNGAPVDPGRWMLTESAAVQHNAARRTAELRAVRPAAGAPGDGPWATGSWGPGSGLPSATGAARPGPERGEHIEVRDQGLRLSGVDAGLGGVPSDSSVPGPARRRRRADRPDDGDRGSSAAPAVADRSQVGGDAGSDALRWNGHSSREDLLRPGGRVALTSSTDPGGSVAGTAADPWLAEALAELDRIVGAPPDRPRHTPDASSGPVASVRSRVDGPSARPTSVTGDGCTVVLDLTDGTGPLPDAVVSPVLAEVESRLADRLPPGGRVRRDTPQSLIVIMPGSDGSAASAWMHGAVPMLAGSLVTGGHADGVLLRASLHGTDGLIGAQVLQRLGARAPGDRTSRFLRPETAEADDGLARAETMRQRSGRLADLGMGRGQRPSSELVRHEPETSADSMVDRYGADPSASAGAPADRTPTGSEAWRRPYLPDGVVVRPGSGGRRHRAEEELPSAPDAPTSAAATGTAEARAAAANVDPDPARPPVDSLGLADLLAGALAAYRRI